MHAEVWKNCRIKTWFPSFQSNVEYPPPRAIGDVKEIPAQSLTLISIPKALGGDHMPPQAPILTAAE